MYVNARVRSLEAACSSMACGVDGDQELVSTASVGAASTDLEELGSGCDDVNDTCSSICESDTETCVSDAESNASALETEEYNDDEMMNFTSDLRAIGRQIKKKQAFDTRQFSALHVLHMEAVSDDDT